MPDETKTIPILANPNKVTVPIELGGSTHRLAVDLNFYVTFEQLTGINLLRGAKSLEGWEPSPREIRAMLTAALNAGGSELTEQEVGSHVHLQNLDYITEKLLEVQKANAAPEGGTSEGNPSAPADTGTGTPASAG